MESERKPRLDSSGGSFNYSSASPHSIEIHKDLQKGISLLKKSVACITAYCYNSLSLEVPPEASTFEAFARLLATLSSSKEVRTVLSSRYNHHPFLLAFDLCNQRIHIWSHFHIWNFFLRVLSIIFTLETVCS